MIPRVPTDTIVSSLAQQFGLGDKARPFVQMLLAHMSDPARGGLSGFIQRLRTSSGAGVVDSWLAAPAEPAAVAGPVVERALDGDGGFIAAVMAKLGLPRSTVVSALGFAVPALVARLSQGGSMPSALPAEAEALIGNRAAWMAGAPADAPRVAAAAVTSRNWMPWVIGAVLIALTLGYCAARKSPQRVEIEPAPVTATAPAIPAQPGAPAVAAEEPAGAAVIALSMNDAPALKVYFDTGKAVVASEFGDKSMALVDYLKANAGAKAVIPGFNDPTGNPALNAELSKNRAKAVQGALQAVGIANEQTVLEKPSDTTGTGSTNAAARRVEVTVRK